MTEDGWYHPVSWKSEWDKAPEREPWVVEPFVSPSRIVTIFSRAGGGKSLLGLEISAGMATGRAVLGQSTCPTRVLYLDHENLVTRDVIPRLKDMEYAEDDLDLLSKNLVYLSFPDMEALDTPEGGSRLVEAVERSRAKYVIIDTVSRTIEGGENDNDTWLNLYKYGLKPLKARGIGVIRLDHMGKDEAKGARGGSAKGGDVDLEWSMTAEGDTLTFKRGKARFEVDEVFTLRRLAHPLRHEPVGGNHPEEPTSSSILERVSRFLEQSSPSTITAVKRGVTGKGETIGHAVRQLKADGFVKVEDGKQVSVKPYRDSAPAQPDSSGGNVVTVDFTNVTDPPKKTRRN